MAVGAGMYTNFRLCHASMHVRSKRHMTHIKHARTLEALRYGLYLSDQVIVSMGYASIYTIPLFAGPDPEHIGVCSIWAGSIMIHDVYLPQLWITSSFDSCLLRAPIVETRASTWCGWSRRSPHHFIQQHPSLDNMAII
jgi:hypothetical protein